MSVQTGTATPPGPASQRLSDRMRYRVERWTAEPNPLWMREMRQSARLMRTPIILMVTPVMLPLIQASRIDPIHFGVLFCIMCVIGLITPPVGVALYGVATVSKLPMERVFWATMPFFLALLGGVAVLVFVPDIVTFLPKLLVK